MDGYEQLSFDTGNIVGSRLTIISGETEEKPKVIVSHCQMLRTQEVVPMDLFHGYDEFYILTYSSSMGFLEDLFDKYGYSYGEMIIGTTRTVHSAQAQLEAVTEVILSQGDVQNFICAHDNLKKRIEEELLEVRVFNLLTDHRKTYILKNNQTGDYRIILGSANASRNAWSGNQLETYQVFDKVNDPDSIAWETFYERSFVLNKELSEPISFKAREIKPDLSNIKQIPLLKKIAEHNEAVVIWAEQEQTEYGTSFLNMGVDPTIRKKLNEGVRDAHMIGNKKGKMYLLNKVEKLSSVVKQKKEEENAKMRAYSQLDLNYDDKSITFNGKKWDLSPTDEDIKSDVLKVVEYADNYNCFNGDVEVIRSIFFKVLNYMFLGPFLGKMRYEAYNYAPDTSAFPLYLVMNGRPSSGKTPMILTITKLMFDFGEQTLKNNILTESVFSRNDMEEYKTQVKGYPIFIDEISPSRWQYAKNIMKMDDYLSKHGYVNIPYFLLLSNDLAAIRGDILKRCIFISVDNQILYEYNTDDHKRMIVNLRKGMHNALYREYCRIMFEKCDTLVDDIRNDKNVDIFLSSSEVLCEIMSRYTELPAAFHPYAKDEYVGDKSFAKRAIKWLSDMVKNNPDMYRISKKEQRIYIDFSSEEQKNAQKDMNMLTQELPSNIDYIQTGSILSMSLSFLEEYTGIKFKKKFDPFRRR